jgi:solute carrier family 8 (sodium/calcium exchanger)
MILLHLTD